MNRLIIGLFLLLVIGGCDKSMKLSPVEKHDLFEEVREGGSDMLKKAIDSGMNPNLFLPDSGYLIFTATAYGNRTAIKMLIEAGADVNAKDEEGDGPLIVAILGGRCEEALLLLSAGADPNEMLPVESAKKSALGAEYFDKTARELYEMNKQISLQAPVNVWEKDKVCWLKVEKLM